MTPATARLLVKAVSGYLVAERSLANAHDLDDAGVVAAAEAYLASLNQLRGVTVAATVEGTK